MTRALRRLALVTGCALAVSVSTACRRETAAREDPIEIAARAVQPEGLDRPLAEGRRRFTTYCAPCHGEGGRGDGQNASRLTPRPPDLETSARRLSTADIRRIVEAGTQALGRTPLCPPHGRTLGPEGVETVVNFVHTLGRQATRP